MKLLETTESKIPNDENGENVPNLEITEVVLIHCNIVNNDYQQDSRVLYAFVPNKSFRQLLDISPKNFAFLKTFNSEFSYIIVQFADQNPKPLETEDKINITLVINQSVKIYNMRPYSVQSRDGIFIKSYGFLSYAENKGKNW